MKKSIKEFLKSFLKKRNIPVFIYFAINLLVMIFGNCGVVVMALGDKLHSMPDDLVNLMIAAMSVVMYAIGIAVSFSPLGDWIVRFKNGCKKIDGHEQEERINSLFNEVLEKARKVNPSLSDNMKIFIKESDEINAFAFGRKTVCITTALLDRSDDEIKGVMAHEIGHIANRDTDLLQVVNVANVYVTLYGLVLGAIVLFYKGTFKAIGWVFTLIAGSIGEAIMAFFTRVFLDLALTALLTAATFLWTALGNILVKESMRLNEYEADKFACTLGYAKPYILLLNEMRLEEKKMSKFKRAVAYMSSDHPSADSRLRELRKFYCSK